MGEKLKTSAARWQVVNVLDLRPDHPKRLWHFMVEKQKGRLHEERLLPDEGPLPQDLVGKDWRAAIQKRLNIAWLPLERVFLRVLRLPVCEEAELESMLELQLEKYSPLPLAQIVWTHLRLPGGLENEQAILLVILPRAVVEEFLGQLEVRGFNADRLDLPVLDQLLALTPQADSAWLLPVNATTVLGAWWAGGAWRNISLLNTGAPADRAAALRGQIAQIQWAGELEGWLMNETEWHLVGGPESVSEWEPAVTEALGRRPDIRPPSGLADLAGSASGRALRSGNAFPMIPGERALAYQQQLNNRLGIGALGAVLAAYMVCVIVYFAALQVVKYQHQRIATRVKEVAGSYTNAVQMQKRVQLLEQQSELKFAALEAWKTASSEMPAELTLNRLTLSRGREMTLAGTAPADASEKITDYNERFTKTTINGQKVAVTSPDTRLGANNTYSWSFRVLIGGDDQ